MACGVCRTDLHVVEGDLPLHRRRWCPGHEVVGVVDDGRRGASSGFAVGDRVGVAWLRSTCGTCRWCASGARTCAPTRRYTGWDDDGGYAEYTVVPAAYAYRVPGRHRRRGHGAAALRRHHRLPRRCSRAAVPPGGTLGIYGFGGSAHLTAQVAVAQGIDVHVFTRDEAARRLALELGASSAGAVDRRAAREARLGDRLRPGG